jgi:hypothetical protein
VFDRVVLADDETECIDGGNDQDPFGYSQFFTLHNQACVQTQTNEGISCDEKDPFRDLESRCKPPSGYQQCRGTTLTMQSLPSIVYAILKHTTEGIYGGRKY